MISGLEHVELGRVEQIRALRSLFGLQGVSTPALAALAAHATPVRIPKGACVAAEGQPVVSLYLVIDGELATYRSGKPLGAFGPRSVVGALASFAREVHGFECTAARDTVALALRAEDVLEVFEDHFEMMHAVLRALARESIDARLRVQPHAGFSNELRPAVEHPCRRPLDLVERLFCLRQAFAQGTMRLDALSEIARTAREVRYPSGTRLWSIGERSEQMLTLICGAISAQTQSGSKFRFGPLDIVGGLDLVAQAPRWYEAVVDEDSVALALDAEVVIDLWEDSPELSRSFLQLLSSTLLSLRERLYAEPSVDAQIAAG